MCSLVALKASEPVVIVVAVLVLIVTIVAGVVIVAVRRDDARYSHANRVPPLFVRGAPPGAPAPEPYIPPAPQVAPVTRVTPPAPTPTHSQPFAAQPADRLVFDGGLTSAKAKLGDVRPSGPRLVEFNGNEPAPDETIRFHRPGEEVLQLLPGHLEVLAGETRHPEIRFVRVPGEQPHLILGRNPGHAPHHVALQSSTVSRRHARLAYANGRWAVANLSETNPVVVNDEELSSIDAERPLVDGDRIELGEVVLRFHAH
jgi:hypothetical protein